MPDITERLGGAMPPKAEPASALLQKLMGSTSPSEVLPFPRKDQDGRPLFEYRVRVLKQSEIDVCSASAEQHTRRVFKGQKDAVGEDIARVRAEAWDDVYQSAKLVELLYHACRDLDDPKFPLFTTPTQIRELLTVDEVAALFTAYRLVQEKLGPLWLSLTDDEVEAWIEKLCKGADLRPLALLAPSALAQLAISLAFRLQNLRTATGSSGSDSNAGAPDDSPIDS
jgi:hypothetical protein